MTRPARSTRRDLVTWGIALAASAVATLIAWAGGARLGAALTAGVIVLMAAVVAAVAYEAGRR